MRAATLTAEFSRENQIREALRAREDSWLNIFKKGHAKLSEIMKADFGTETPNGLDIDYWPGESRIDFKKSSFTERFMGHVKWVVPDTVRFHPILNLVKDLPIPQIRKNLVDMLSHETIHTRQGKEAQYGLGQLYNGFFLDNIPKSQTEEAKAQAKRIERNSLVKSFGKYKVAGYLDEQVEIQARMHEIVSKAYHDWGRMPITPEGALAAMHHVGLDVPSKIISDLQRTREGRKALNDFQINPVTKDAVKRPVALLNKVNDYAEVCNIPAKTWKSEHLHYYGGLLELYGDKKGRARMFEMQSFHEVKKALKAVDDSEELDGQGISKISKSFPEFYISGFLFSLINQGNDKELVIAFAQEFKDQGKEIPPEFDDMLPEEAPACV